MATKKKSHQQPAPKPRVKSSASQAAGRILAILRALPTDERRQVIRSVTAFYQDGSA